MTSSYMYLRVLDRKKGSAAYLLKPIIMIYIIESAIIKIYMIDRRDGVTNCDNRIAGRPS